MFFFVINECHLNVAQVDLHEKNSFGVSCFMIAKYMYAKL